MLRSNSNSVIVIYVISMIITVAGLWHFDFTIGNYLLIVLGYFLYSGIGVSMMMHRYYTHKSFEFKNSLIKWIFTIFALAAGRGATIGWVYIHRLHHAYSDTEKDPHVPNLNIWNLFFPKYSHFDGKVNLRLVKDLLKEPHIFIDKYYNLLILIWAVILYSISPNLFYFGWVIPVALTHIALNSFLYFGHAYGYTNHSHRDDSKNLWPFSVLLWGEGWHNNHHKNPSNWNLSEKWWEIDIIGFIIRFIKK
jgi:fatty-acid desaturase